MRISRRKFLRSGTTAAAIGAGAVLAPRFASAQRSARPVDGVGPVGPRAGFDSFNAIGNYSRADFEALVGTKFNLISDTYGHRTVTLKGVRSDDTLKGSEAECFSLVFEGRGWEDVCQDVYYVSHDTLGHFHALMSPVRESGGSERLCYEAVVNRWIS